MDRSWGRIIWVLVVAMAAVVAIECAWIRSAPGQVAAGLRLNEILAGPARDWDGNGAYDAKGDEWVEVQNNGSNPVSLDEYRLTDADRAVRFGFSGSLAPGGIKLVTGSDAVAWQRSAGISTSGLSLNNSGDTVYLLRVMGADTTVVDVHAYGSIEAGTDRSTGHASSESSDWILFDSLNPYTGSGTPSGTGCAPSPGAPNGCTSGVQSTTWGKVKRLYR